MAPSERPPVIGFLTDFGFDGAAATCRGVMLSICPTAQIVDISHAVRKYAVRDGAFVLRATLPYLPVGVHVGVVDPGVGTDRRPIAIRADRGDVLVGPDNGLLLPAADALGGPVEARELANRGPVAAGRQLDLPRSRRLRADGRSPGGRRRVVCRCRPGAPDRVAGPAAAGASAGPRGRRSRPR